METIAVYWEPIIKIYGFDTREMVALLRCAFPGELLDTVSDHLSGELNEEQFLFSEMHGNGSNGLELALVVPCDQAQRLAEQLSARFAPLPQIHVKLHSPVDLLFFHGPHFQDRYGIAERVFHTLSATDFTIHAIGCTGTSIYLVTGTAQANQVKLMLTEAFTVPMHMDHKKNRHRGDAA